MPDELDQKMESKAVQETVREAEPQTERNIEQQTELSSQHFSASGIESAEQEESYQASERDAFFNNDAEGEAEAELSAYTLTDPASVSEQLVITNELLTYSLAVNIVLYLLVIAAFVIRFLRSIITKIF